MTLPEQPDPTDRTGALSTVSGRELGGVVAVIAAGMIVAFGLIVAAGALGVRISTQGPYLELAFGYLAYAAVIFAVWVVAIRPGGRDWTHAGLRDCGPGLLVLGGVAAVAWVAVSSLIYVAFGMWDTALAGGRKLVAPLIGDPLSLGALFLLAGPVAALVEEVLYRGLLYGWLRRRLGIASAVIVSAVLFTCSHVYIFAAGISFVIEMTLLSMLLALLFEYSRSLWPGIVCHGLNNMIILALYLT